MSYINILPFFTLLLTVTIGPVVFKKSWNNVFIILTAMLSTITLCNFFFIKSNFITPLLALYEYIQFILLITALYIVAGGIEIKINTQGRAVSNCLLLLCGGICANLIGTTGAAMLFINPFLKINKGRIKQYHIAFFIFLVCNIGGSLSPIGDPPLYIGFIKGIPFLWTLIHNFLPWLITTSLLLLLFFYIDSKNKNISQIENENGEMITIRGKINFLWIFIIICSLFLNPNIFPALPSFSFHGHKICLIREFILLTVCFCAYKKNKKEILIANSFSLEPIKELIILFFGIFITMPPVIEMIGELVHNIDSTKITPSFLFWTTGFLSSLLDNAPTYLNMLTVSMSANGLDINNVNDVCSFAKEIAFIPSLRAISIAAIFFGSMTYISNGPNFMIKSIAEKNGIKMASFWGFVFKYSLPFLIPIFILVRIIFC